MEQSQKLSATNGYAEAFWKSQAAAAEHMQSFMDDWYARRREAASEASECCSRMLQGEGAAEAFAEWTRAEMDRLGEDARAQAELTAALSNDALSAFASKNGSKRSAKKKNGAAAASASESQA
ncbi:MAG: hypothetical protein PVI23_03195 [Maricaulaceae bacterium]